MEDPVANALKKLAESQAALVSAIKELEGTVEETNELLLSLSTTLKQRQPMFGNYGPYNDHVYNDIDDPLIPSKHRLI